MIKITYHIETINYEKTEVEEEYGLWDIKAKQLEAPDQFSNSQPWSFKIKKNPET